jgi:hypothetical protein
MSQEKSIKFSFARIITDDFKIVSEQSDASLDAMVNANMAFGFNAPEKILAMQLNCVLVELDKILMNISVTCQFRLVPEDWASCYHEETNKLTIPKLAALHLASLTVSTARGVMHAKTEGHALNSLIIPPINVNDFVKGDLVLGNAPAAVG